MRRFWEDFTELFYPRLCLTCNRKLITQEKFVCLECLSDLPRTRFHEDPSNKIAQLFWGRTRLIHATSWLYFRKGSKYQKMIHFLKYKGLKEIGEEMGKIFGQEIRESGFGEADILLPVPLHPRKLRQRGYNQSEWIARGMAQALSRQILTGILVREIHTPTQTRRNRFERWQNVEGIFRVREPEAIFQKHVLVVDDVVTTGSTLEAAAEALLRAGAAGVSIATLACAEM